MRATFTYMLHAVTVAVTPMRPSMFLEVGGLFPPIKKSLFIVPRGTMKMKIPKAAAYDVNVEKTSQAAHGRRRLPFSSPPTMVTYVSRLATSICTCIPLSHMLLLLQRLILILIYIYFYQKRACNKKFKSSQLHL